MYKGETILPLMFLCFHPKNYMNLFKILQKYFHHFLNFFVVHFLGPCRVPLFGTKIK